ncbi:MAG: hypothetical protein ACM3SS_25130 [Rhodospirillaceae bacterium]
MLLVVAGLSVAGLVYEVETTRSRARVDDGNLEQVFFSCKNAIRPLLPGGLMFDHPEVRRSGSRYTLTMRVSHSFSDNVTRVYYYACEAELADDRVVVRRVSSVDRGEQAH